MKKNQGGQMRRPGYVADFKLAAGYFYALHRPMLRVN